jgi:hypothetical protein
MTSRTPLLTVSAVVVAASIAACGGSTSGPMNLPLRTPVPTGAPVSTPAPTTGPSTQQVVTMAEPDTAIGSVVTPTFGLVGGYTQQTYSQVLGFAPGSQIMIRNGQAAVPHTFSVISTTGFVGAPTSLTASGGSTIAAGFNTGTVNGGTLIGPFTLSAGTFFVGCVFHYASENMRTVLVVAANATPGPQATPPPNVPPPPPGSIY